MYKRTVALHFGNDETLLSPGTERSKDEQTVLNSAEFSFCQPQRIN